MFLVSALAGLRPITGTVDALPHSSRALAKTTGTRAALMLIR